MAEETSSRREFLGWLSAAAGAVAVGSSLDSRVAQAADLDPNNPINVIIPKDFQPDVSEEAQGKVVRATLDFMEDLYGSSGKVFLWGKKFNQIDFEKRLKWIATWTAVGIEANADVYPVDMPLFFRLMLRESQFYEFAVSDALAVGPCQFIFPTAREFYK